jgi:hypothetical protein
MKSRLFENKLGFGILSLQNLIDLENLRNPELLSPLDP